MSAEHAPTSADGAAHRDHIDMAPITGRTRLYAILADPILHVKTPDAINKLLRKWGIDGVMVPMHVGPDELSTVVAGLKGIRNFAGFIATVPHKSAMAALCDHISERATMVGAVNAVRRNADGTMAGDMLDGLGFIEGLRSAGIDPAGRSVYLAGAGGAASAIAFALVDAGISRLTIANRTRARSEALARRISRYTASVTAEIGDTDPSRHDIVVNGTSLGLHAGDPLPLDASRLTANQIVAEIIMDPETTPLLAAAQARGCRIHPGWPMLACQLEMMADFMGLQGVPGASRVTVATVAPAAAALRNNPR